MNCEVVKLLARYNSHVNTEMNKIISTLSPTEWEKNFDGYFNSVHALCSHLFKGDHIWLNRFSIIKKFNYFESSIFDKKYLWNDNPFNSIDEYKEKRKLLDTAFFQLAEEISKDDLLTYLDYTNIKGIAQHRQFGWLILHVFNHQTHHRGMISLYLEMLGKENDFSNLVNIV
jgi:uncharacterized damage-inducible protein DinB